MSNYQINKTRGWISLYRSIQDNDLWLSEKFTKGQAWLDILLITNRKDNIIFVRGNEVKIKRGQFAYSQETLAKRWKWSRNKVIRFINSLKTRGQLVENLNDKTIQQNKYILTVYTVLNYDDYQRNDTADDTAERQQTIQQKDINNNSNNKDKENKDVRVLPHQQLNYLLNIPDEDLLYLKNKLNANTTDVKRKAEELYNYCQAKSKIYKNYKAFLRNALIKDFGYTFKN